MIQGKSPLIAQITNDFIEKMKKLKEVFNDKQRYIGKR